jgi:hypothetical protein
MNQDASPARINFNERPFIVIWETTHACDLVCAHCRACAQPARSPLELSTTEAEGLIDEVARMEVPVFVLTDGDPLKRPDIYELVEYAWRRRVRISRNLRRLARPRLCPDRRPLRGRTVLCLRAESRCNPCLSDAEALAGQGLSAEATMAAS